MAACSAVFDSISSTCDNAMVSLCSPADSNIMVREDNLQEQRDEVLAIQSIYEDSDEQRITVLSEPDERGHGLFDILIKVPVATPSESFQVDLMLPVSEDSSVCQQEGGSPMEAGGGQEEGAGPLKEGGSQEEEEGAAALTPPSDIGRGVVLQRSLSGQRWTGSFHLRHLCPLTLHLTFPPGYPSSDPPAFALSCVWLCKTQISALCKQLDRLWEATPNMPIVFSWMDWLENETVSCLGLTNNLVLMPESDDSDDVDGRAMSECLDLGQAVHTLLQYSSQKEAVEFCKAMQECCLCLDEKPGTKFVQLHPCKHHFCFDCIATHCNLHVSAGTVQLLTCPASECKVTVSPDVLQTVLSPEAFIRWETLSLQRSLDEMEDIVYCPRCQAVVIREQDTALNLGYCLACCFSFCTECEQPWHQGSECMSDLERLAGQRIQVRDVRARQRYEQLRQQAIEKAESMSRIKSKTVPCPHCRVPVEKIEGCNKMTCRCGKSFCWLCGKAINGYNHFTQSSCVLFHQPLPAVIQRAPQRRPPDALLWMQAQVEMLDDHQDRKTRCAQCKQTNYKLDKNNHIRCWNCKTNLCFHCSSKITGVVTRHFTTAGCPQHS